jgi:NAD(P)H-hydrate repair Nnr-like enzyme with NAD(P)H-hydrate dehydratase domain
VQQTPGLGTSGSGDVLAGAVAGLAARGATPLDSALWGLHLHGTSGERLARRVGAVGFLARELLDEMPAVLDSLTRDRDAT